MRKNVFIYSKSVAYCGHEPLGPAAFWYVNPLKTLRFGAVSSSGVASASK
jgi:hypothetical protein